MEAAPAALTAPTGAAVDVEWLKVLWSRPHGDRVTQGVQDRSGATRAAALHSSRLQPGLLQRPDVRFGLVVICRENEYLT